MQLHIERQDRYGLRMATVNPAEAGLGLRERKNRRTRREIVRAMSTLTIEGGWASATIPRIAERADVAPRTVSTWFPSKDDIVFERIDEVIGRSTRHMTEGDGDVVDRLEAWIHEEVAEHPAADPELARLRRAAIEHDPELRARDRQHYERLQAEIAKGVARDVGGEPGDMGPQIFAGAAMGFLWKLGELSREDGEGPRDGLPLITEGLGLLRGTLAAVTAARLD
jgi:AcrR family transcriptional regulator